MPGRDGNQEGGGKNGANRRGRGIGEEGSLGETGLKRRVNKYLAVRFLHFNRHRHHSEIFKGVIADRFSSLLRSFFRWTDDIIVSFFCFR